MSGLIQKAKEVVHDVTHKDKTNTTGTHATGTHTTGTHATGAHATGTHTTGTHATGTHGSTNAGPHSSNALNAADPRVDSDLDGSRNAGLNQTTHSTGHHQTAGTTGIGGTTHGSTGFGSSTHGSTNAGPHSSNLANSADPRVDSDLDGGRHAGLNQTTHTGGYPSTTGTHTTGHVGNTTHGSTNAGPHTTNIANKLDPRVDSDLDGGRHAGLNQTTHTGGYPSTSGTHTAGHTGASHSTGTAGSTTAGPHSSNLMNKIDPRVDSDLDGGRHAGMNQTTHAGGYPSTTGTHTAGHTGTTHAGTTHAGTTHAGTTHTGATHTTGTTGSTNAGPHKSNLLNKLDPRVDSDLDRSNNAGMNQTTRTNY